MSKPLFDNDNAERCFRAWQAENKAKLDAIFTITDDKSRGYDRHCLAIYTGNIPFRIELK